MVDFQEIEKLAYQNQPMPMFSSQSEQLAYLSMQALYNDFQKKLVAMEQAKIERDKIELAYENEKLEKLRILDLYKRSNEVNVKLAGISKLVETGGCERCKTIMRILDGRIT